MFNFIDITDSNSTVIGISTSNSTVSNIIVIVFFSLLLIGQIGDASHWQNDLINGY